MPEYIQGDNHFAKAYRTMKEVLQGDYFEIPKKLCYEILEVEGGEHKFICSLQLGKEIIQIDQQQAAGTLDAFNLGLRSALFDSYSSLKSLSMVRFAQKSVGKQTSSNINPNSKEIDVYGFDMKVETLLTFRNKRGSEFTFKRTSFDFVQSALLLTLEATLFFVNSEEAYKRARYRCEEGKSDFDYIRDVILPVLSRNNDYSDIAKKIKEEADIERSKIPDRGGLAPKLKYYFD